MESFASYYDPSVSIKIIYEDIQTIQNRLLVIVLGESQCNVSSSVLFVEIENGRLDIDPMSADMMKIALDESYQLYIIVGIVYIIDVQGGHYGSIIFDKTKMTFSIYDPSYAQLQKDQIMTHLASEITNITGYRFEPIPCFMDFQHETIDYFCSIWSFMMMYQVCRSSIPIDKVIHSYSKMTPEQLKREIGGFLYFLYLKVQEYDLMPEINKIKSFMINLLRDKTIPISKARELFIQVQYSIDPFSIMDAYRYSHEYKLDYIHRVYLSLGSRLLPANIDEFILALDKPMDIATFSSGVEMIYTQTIQGPDSIMYAPRLLFMRLKDIFPEIDMFRKTIEDISYKISYSFDIKSVNESIQVLQKEFSQFYKIPGNDYRIWSFIFEFYVRYFLLDTYGLKGNDLMLLREKKYHDMLTKYNIHGRDAYRILYVMLYTPIKYVDMWKFLTGLPYRINDDVIIDAMIAASLVKTSNSSKIFRERLSVLLSVIKE